MFYSWKSHSVKTNLRLRKDLELKPDALKKFLGWKLKTKNFLQGTAATVPPDNVYKI